MLRNIKDGVTELSCHPGYISEEIRSKYKWHLNCENELNALLDPSFQAEIKNRGIKLVSHAELM